MNWWRELTEEGPDGSNLDWILWATMLVAIPVIPIVVIAVGMSFIVPVQRWFAVLVVLTGLPVQVRLFWAVLEQSWTIPLAYCVGTAAAWVVGAFVVGHLLGPLPAAAGMVFMSPNAVWAIGRLEYRPRRGR